MAADGGWWNHEPSRLDQTPITVPTVLVFDGRTGRLLKEWGDTLFALPHSVTLDRQDNIWITDVVTDIGDDSVPDRSRIYVMGPQGSSIGRIGRKGNYDGQFMVAHGVAVGKGGEAYVADFSGRRVQKFLRKY